VDPLEKRIWWLGRNPKDFHRPRQSLFSLSSIFTGYTLGYTMLTSGNQTAHLHKTDRPGAEWSHFRRGALRFIGLCGASTYLFELR
jgi:hypothetical protein